MEKKEKEDDDSFFFQRYACTLFLYALQNLNHKFQTESLIVLFHFIIKNNQANKHHQSCLKL